MRPRTHLQTRGGIAAPLPKGDGPRIESLEALDPELLRRRWRSAFGKAAPARLPRSLIVRILFWREQVSWFGDVDEHTRALLDAGLSDATGRGPVGSSSPVSKFRPGTVLSREHGGTLHRVLVLEHGFAWNGVSYRSLSHVARAITGTNWNGPRFFGLGRWAGKRTAGRQERP